MIAGPCICPTRSGVDPNPMCDHHGEARPCPHCGEPMERTRVHLFIGGPMVKRRLGFRCTDERCVRERATLAKRHAFDRGECT